MASPYDRKAAPSLYDKDKSPFSGLLDRGPQIGSREGSPFSGLLETTEQDRAEYEREGDLLRSGISTTIPGVDPLTRERIPEFQEYRTIPDPGEPEYTAGEFLDDAADLSLFYPRYIAMKTGAVYGAVEPDVARAAFSFVAAENKEFQGAAYNIDRLLRTAFRRYEQRVGGSNIDEETWVQTYRSLYAGRAGHLLGWTEEAPQGTLRQHLLDRERLDERGEIDSTTPEGQERLKRIYKIQSQSKPNGDKYMKAELLEDPQYRLPLRELSKDESKSLTNSFDMMDTLAEQYYPKDALSSLRHFRDKMMTGEDAGRFYMLMDNLAELNQGTWHLIAEILATVPDTEYDKLAKGMDLPEWYPKWLRAGLTTGRGLGVGMRAAVEAFNKDPAGFFKARPLDVTMIVMAGLGMAGGVTRALKAEAFQGKPPRLRQLADALEANPAGAMLTKTLNWLETPVEIMGKTFVKWDKEVFGRVKQALGRDFRIRDVTTRELEGIRKDVLPALTKGDMIGNMIKGVALGTVMGVPELGALQGLLKNVHAHGLTYENYSTYSRFLDQNLKNYYKQRTPRQEREARYLSYAAARGWAEFGEAAARLGYLVRTEGAGEVYGQREATPTTREGRGVAGESVDPVPRKEGAYEYEKTVVEDPARRKQTNELLDLEEAFKVWRDQNQESAGTPEYINKAREFDKTISDLRELISTPSGPDYATPVVKNATYEVDGEVFSGAVVADAIRRQVRTEGKRRGVVRTGGLTKGEKLQRIAELFRATESLKEAGGVEHGKSAAELTQAVREALNEGITSKEISDAIEAAPLEVVAKTGPHRFVLRNEASEMAYQQVVADDVRGATPAGAKPLTQRAVSQRIGQVEEGTRGPDLKPSERPGVTEDIIRRTEERLGTEREQTLAALDQMGIRRRTAEQEVTASGAILPEGEGGSKGLVLRELERLGVQLRDGTMLDPLVPTAPMEGGGTRYFERPVSVYKAAGRPSGESLIPDEVRVQDYPVRDVSLRDIPRAGDANLTPQELARRAKLGPILGKSTEAAALEGIALGREPGPPPVEGTPQLDIKRERVAGEPRRGPEFPELDRPGPVRAAVRRQGGETERFPEEIARGSDEMGRYTAAQYGRAHDPYLNVPEGIKRQLRQEELDRQLGALKDPDLYEETVVTYHKKAINDAERSVDMHRLYDDAVDMYGGRDSVPPEITDAYARNLASRYGPDSEIAREFADVLPGEFLEGIRQRTERFGLEPERDGHVSLHDHGQRIKNPAPAPLEVSLRSELPTDTAELLVNQAKEVLPPKDTLSFLNDETPPGVQVLRDLVEENVAEGKITPEDAKTANRILGERDVRSMEAGAPMPPGTQNNGVNRVADNSPRVQNIVKEPILEGDNATYILSPTQTPAQRKIVSKMFKILDKLGLHRGVTSQGRKVYGLMAAMSDAIAGGYSVLASQKLRQRIAEIAADKVLEGLGRKGDRLLRAKEMKAVLKWLEDFDIPVIYPEAGAEILARIPGGLDRSGVRVDLKELTDTALVEFRKNPKVFDDIAADAVKNIGETIQSEAARAGFTHAQFGVVLDYFRGENIEDYRKPNGELDWPKVEEVLKNMGEAELAQTIALQRVVYNEGMPSFIPGHVKAADIVSWARGNKEALTNRLNSELKETRGTGLTDKELTTIFGKENPDSPSSVTGGIVGKEFESLLDYNKLGKDLRVGFLPTWEAGKGIVRGKGRAAELEEPIVHNMLRDLAEVDVYERNLLDPIWDMQIEPNINNSYGWMHMKYLPRNAFQKWTVNAKGKMTIWNFVTQQGNYFSNVGAMSLYLGNSPVDAMAQTIASVTRAHRYNRLKKAGAPKSEYAQGEVPISDLKGRLYDQLPRLEQRDSDLASAELGKLEHMDDLINIAASVDSPAWTAFKDYLEYFKGDVPAKAYQWFMKRAEKLSRKGYNLGDASAKLALTEYHWEIQNRMMREMEVGNQISLEQSEASTILLEKTKTGWKTPDGKRTYKELGRDKELDHLIARTAEREAFKLIPNYNDPVGAMIPLMRHSAFGVPFSWFPTWAYKVMDTIGKRGILSGVFYNETGYRPVNDAGLILRHEGRRMSRVLRQVAYQNSLQGIANEQDLWNARAAQRGPGSVTRGDNIVYDADEYDYAWVKSMGPYNPFNPSITATLLLMQGISHLDVAGMLGEKPNEELSKLRRAFKKGYLEVSTQEVLQLAGMGGNVASEIIMMGNGYKQFGYREPGLVDYASKAGSAFVGGSVYQALDALMASGGPDWKIPGTDFRPFYGSRYQFAEPYRSGDKRAALPFARQVIARMFGGFRKVELSERDFQHAKKFARRMQAGVDRLRLVEKNLYNTGQDDKAIAVAGDREILQEEIEQQLHLLFQRVKKRRSTFDKRRKPLNIGSLGDGN